MMSEQQVAARGMISVQEVGEEARALSDMQLIANGYIFILAGTFSDQHTSTPELHSRAAEPGHL